MRDALSNSRLLSELTPEQRSVAIAAMTEEAELRRVEPAQVIVAEGDTVGVDSKGQFRGDLYVIRLGSAEVFQSAGGMPRVLARLLRNDYFGEISLLARSFALTRSFGARIRAIGERQRFARSIAWKSCAFSGDLFRRIWNNGPN